MKAFAKIILSFITLLPILAMADELPNSAFKELINIRETHLKNASQDNIDSYYFLFGMALKNDDLVNAGRVYFQNGLENNKNKLTYEEVLSQRKKLGLEKLDLSQSNDKVNLFCRLEKDDCIQVLFDSQQYWQPAINKYGVLLNRYQEFLNREPAVTEHLLTRHSPIPEYLALLKAQRLTHLTYLNAENKNTNIANELAKEREILKNQLKWADSLTQKVIMERMLFDNLQISVLLKTRYDINHQKIIKNLSQDEKSLKLAIAYEFLDQEQEMKYMMTNLQDMQNNELFKDISEYVLSESTPLERNAIESGNYQHNKTYNAIANYLLEQIELSEKSAIEIGQYQLNKNETDYSIKIDKQDNELGFLFANISVADYGQYVQRLNELDNVINMTNYILTGNDSYLINVFTGDNKGVIKDAEKICMPLPKADNGRTQTCLYL